MDGLDLTVWPCHPLGSWQRALLHQSLGLPVDDADAAALAKWDRHPATLTWTQCMNGVVSKYTLLHQEQRVIGAVIDAATTVLSPSEVVGSRELARRIAGMPGVPHHNRTMAILKAAGPSNHEVHMLQGGTTRRRMYKRYIDNLSGRPGHFFTRRMDNFDKFIAARRVQQAKHCDDMRAVFLHNHYRQESVNQ